MHKVRIHLLECVVLLYDRFGRKKGVIVPMLLAAVGAAGAVLLTTDDESNKGITVKCKCLHHFFFTIMRWNILTRVWYITRRHNKLSHTCTKQVQNGQCLAYVSSCYFLVLLGFLVGKIILSMVWAKFWIMISFDGVYIYSAELFPTVVRYDDSQV